MKRIVLLGSTGSIGRQALDVVRACRSQCTITGIAARSRIDEVRRQIKEFRPRIVSLWNEKDARELRAWCRKQHVPCEVVYGPEGLIQAATFSSADLVLSSVVGAVGLPPLMAAIRAGKDIALANKEALVVAGSLVMSEVKKRGVALLPVDSEHSAIFQCLKNEPSHAVSRIILTASGGPFYRSTKNHRDITVSDALDHPTWDMGPKITVDSASLMNKGLEAIEAHHLFQLPLKQVDIVIHPQSIVHSLVEFVDHSVLAQLSWPDMRLPIQYALTYPERIPSALRPLDLIKAKCLQFDRPDFRKFKCLTLALAAGTAGGTMPAVMNAANEVAVEFFLKKMIRFSDIPKVIEKVMNGHKNKTRPALDEILAADAEARLQAQRSARKYCTA